MKRLLFIIALVIRCTGIAWGQNASDEQILVFRKSGCVDIFYTSTLKSISMAEDTAQAGNGPVQLFALADTTIAIPVAEIDSVTFGSRNRVVFNKDVVHLTEEHVAAVLSFDGTELVFAPGTDRDLIPDAGSLLYCDIVCEAFPYGLTARVLKRSGRDDGAVVLEVEAVQLEEIFDDLFFAGDIGPQEADRTTMPARKADDNKDKYDKSRPFDFHLDILQINGECGLRFTDVVVNLPKHYYTANIHIEPKLMVDLEFLKVPKLYEKTETSQQHVEFPVATICGVIHSRFLLHGFYELSVEASGHIGLSRTSHHTYKWTRADGEQKLEEIKPADGGKPSYSSDVELTLEGEFYTGLQADLKIGVIGDVTGVGVRGRLGPSVKGSFGLDALEILQKHYSPTEYASAELSASLKGNLSFYYYWREWLLGKEKEKTLYDTSYDIIRFSIDLLPHFTNLLARPARKQVAPEAPPVPVITAATRTDDHLLKDLEAGFALVDNETGQIVDTVSTAIVGFDDEPQAFASYLIPEPEVKDYSRYTLYPTIQYAGRRILAAPADISSGARMSPVFFKASTPTAYAVGGSHTVGTALLNQTEYIIGNIMPAMRLAGQSAAYDPRFPDIPLDAEALRSTIVGEWQGHLRDRLLDFSFREDLTGSLQGEAFAYEIEQSDKATDIAITFTPGGRQTAYRLVTITPNSITLYTNEYKQLIKLYRK